MEHISTALESIADVLRNNRDNEVTLAGDVLVQYIIDHHDKAAYRAVDRQVNALARAWDRMIAKLDKWAEEARKIEGSCDNFYGD